MKKIQIKPIEENPILGAILVNLTIKHWANTKKVPIEKLNKISNKKLSTRLKASKDLVDKKLLENINTVINKARMLVKSKSLPFPVDGFYLCPKKSIQTLCEELDEIIEMLEEPLDDFAKDYEEMIKASEEELGSDFFNRDDYPKDIKSKFGIKYRLFDLKPSEEIKEFDPDLYKEEQEKFKEMMDETRNECISFLRNGFLQILQSLTDTLTGDKRIRQDSIDRIEKFFLDFTTKDIFKDEELKHVLQDTKKTLFGISAKDLRDNKILKESIQNEIKKINENLNNIMENKTRKLTIKKK